MWQGLANAALPVATGGKLFVAIYNDTGTQSDRWLWIKRIYNRLPNILKSPFALLAITLDEGKAMLRAFAKLSPATYFRSWTRYDKNNRGMSRVGMT